MFARYIQSLAFLVVVSLLLLSAPRLRAQEPQEKSSVQFSCLIWKKLPYPELYYRSAGKVYPLELFMNFRSSLYPISAGMEKFELFTQSTDDDGNMKLELVGSTKVVPKSKRMLFVIQESQKGAALPLQIFGLDDSLENFPMGSFRFLNFTTVPLAVSFNGGIKEVKPNALTSMSSKVSEGGGFLPFAIINKKGDKLFETRLYSQSRGREMVFIGPPSVNKDRLTIKFISEVIPPPKTKGVN